MKEQYEFSNNCARGIELLIDCILHPTKKFSAILRDRGESIESIDFHGLIVAFAYSTFLINKDDMIIKNRSGELDPQIDSYNYDLLLDGYTMGYEGKETKTLNEFGKYSYHLIPKSEQIYVGRPVINKAEVNDSLWIINNIRNCFAHGLFRYSSEEKCLYFCNEGVGHLMDIEVPPQWVYSLGQIIFGNKNYTGNTGIINTLMVLETFEKDTKPIKCLSQAHELLNKLPILKIDTEIDDTIDKDKVEKTFNINACLMFHLKKIKFLRDKHNELGYGISLVDEQNANFIAQELAVFNVIAKRHGLKANITLKHLRNINGSKDFVIQRIKQNQDVFFSVSRSEQMTMIENWLNEKLVFNDKDNISKGLKDNSIFAMAMLSQDFDIENTCLKDYIINDDSLGTYHYMLLSAIIAYANSVFCYNKEQIFDKGFSYELLDISKFNCTYYGYADILKSDINKYLGGDSLFSIKNRLVEQDERIRQKKADLEILRKAYEEETIEKKKIGRLKGITIEENRLLVYVDNREIIQQQFDDLLSNYKEEFIADDYGKKLVEANYLLSKQKDGIIPQQYVPATEFFRNFRNALSHGNVSFKENDFNKDLTELVLVFENIDPLNNKLSCRMEAKIKDVLSLLGNRTFLDYLENIDGISRTR